MNYNDNHKNYKKPLTLGTAQFGLNYGITNNIGKVNSEIAIDIIRKAISKGVKYIDTAASYGESEEIIGRALSGKSFSEIKIITKLFPFEQEFINNINETTLKKLIRNSISSR